jgi:CBS domain-containing protein
MRSPLLQARDVMTHPAVAVTPETSVLDAIRRMLKTRITGIPVVGSEGRLVGIVTASDFMRRAELGTEAKRSKWLDALFGPAEAAEAYARSHGQKVGEVMTRHPATVFETTPLDEVVALLERRGVKHLPVIRADKVVGMVSRTDLMRALVKRHRAARRAPGNAALRSAILSAIDAEVWADGARVDVVAHDGSVDVWGTLSDIEQRDALLALVESVPGVKTVGDHLTWQDSPVSVT